MEKDLGKVWLLFDRVPSNTDGFVEKEFRLITISCLIKLAEGWHWSEEGRGEVVSSWRS